jgi:hypothetical protein
MTINAYPHTAADVTRFEARVQRTDGDGCWRWTGAKFDERGYGCFTLKRRAVRAHRFAWYVEHGQPMPLGMVVMHICDNPSCVRPSHLVLAPQIENVRDRDAKGRTARGESAGRSKLTDEQVATIRNDPRGHQKVASEYGVARSLVQRIRQRKAWTHV